VLSFAGVINISLLPLLVVAAVTLVAIALVEPLRRLLAGERPLLSDSAGSFLVQAFFELFETVIAFLSNTLSYVRLGAFAVAHIGLTLIVFILADLAGGIAPLRWIVIVLGTIAVVAFEGLIVGIQTLRLEYYEFFNKFFQGTGISYRPLDLPEA
jgi:V/A-type H+/Na+-transporting ATPase subunit I